MAAHSQFTVASGVPVHFCDPRRPWQRGTNELLRRYLPRKSRFADRTQDELDAIAVELNGRPRKTLDFLTPAQALETVLS